MAIFYNEGESKVRPGVYQRHVNVGTDSLAGAQDGICAIPIRASWGPLGKVVRNTGRKQLERVYGSGDYGAAHTVPAAAEMFQGGAATVYTYRLGTGGTEAKKVVAEGLTVTAKYPGAVTLAISVQAKLGDSATKVFNVYFNSALVESFEFSADGATEGHSLAAVAAASEYVIVTAADTVETVPIVAAASGALTGGANPTVTNGSYSDAFAALESYYYNTIALDVDDDANLTLSLLLQAYLDEAYKMGKLGVAVVGEKASVSFANRLAHSKSFNDAKVVYLGGGWMAETESKDGVLAICRTAGVIASTPSNQGITHTVITGATDLCESLTYAQYEDAIKAGMLMVSMSPEGSIWYDAAINTLVSPERGTQDEGWKKIRRVKVRFELIDRLDRELAPKVGRVSADSDGIADVVQTGQRVLTAMIGEGKLQPGASFTEDPDNPYSGDSAWFIIQADDIDSLEKIYLQYQFRYSMNA